MVGNFVKELKEKLRRFYNNKLITDAFGFEALDQVIDLVIEATANYIKNASGHDISSEVDGANMKYVCEKLLNQDEAKNGI